MSHNTTWEINGVSLTLDLADADVLERYEDAFDELEKAGKQLPKDGRQSERIRALLAVYRQLFDDIFAANVSEQIFADQPNSVVVYENIIENFLAFVRDQRSEISKQSDARLNKYRPNRAQKRAAKKPIRKPK